jgi:hypothetical protein
MRTGSGARGGLARDPSRGVCRAVTADRVHDKVQRRRREAVRPAPDYDPERQQTEQRRRCSARCRRLERRDPEPGTVGFRRLDWWRWCGLRTPVSTGNRGQHLADVTRQRPRSGSALNAIALVDGQPGAAIPAVEWPVAALFGWAAHGDASDYRGATSPAQRTDAGCSQPGHKLLWALCTLVAHEREDAQRRG